MLLFFIVKCMFYSTAAIITFSNLFDFPIHFLMPIDTHFKLDVSTPQNKSPFHILGGSWLLRHGLVCVPCSELVSQPYRSSHPLI